MALQLKISIDKTNNEEIIIRWEQGFKNSKIIFSDRIIGEFATKEELFIGKSFALDADETIFVQFNSKHKQFVLKKNGAYIDNSPYHPKHDFNSAIWINIFCGLIYLAAGVWLLISSFGYYWGSFDYYSGIFHIIISSFFLIIPIFLKKGIPFLFYIFILLITTYIFIIVYFTWIFASLSWPHHYLETFFGAFIICLPSLIGLFVVILKHKLYRELCNIRSMKNNFNNVIS